MEINGRGRIQIQVETWLSVPLIAKTKVQMQLLPLSTGWTGAQIFSNMLCVLNKAWNLAPS